MNTSKLSLIKNNVSKKVLLFSTLHQALIAISTYIILSLANEGDKNNVHEMKEMLAIFLSLTVVSYIVGGINNYFLKQHTNNKWCEYSSFVYDSVIQANFIDNNTRDKTHNWLITEAMDSLGNINYFLKDNYELLLSITFNIYVIYIVLDKNISLIIIASFVCTALFISIFKRFFEFYASDIQNTKQALFMEMAKHIDKIVYLPQSTRSIQRQKLDTLRNAYFKPEQKYELISTILPTLFTITSCSGFLLYIIYSSSLTSWNILALVIAFPRILAILQYAYVLLDFQQNLYFWREKYNNMLRFPSEHINNLDLKNLIRMNEISFLFRGKEITYGELLNTLNSDKKGHVLVSGDNGVGKSLVLKNIKFLYPNSILISPENIASLSPFDRSTGQRFMSLLEEIKAFEDRTIILLDEFRANLSQENKKQIGAFISDISQYKMVIEICH